MHWVKKTDLPFINAVDDLETLIRVMLDDSLTEFQYIPENDEWKIVIK